MGRGRQMHDNKWILPALCMLLLAAAIGSLFIGRYPVSIPEALGALIGGQKAGADNTVYRIMGASRLPRVVAAILAGSALSAAGASYQGIFKNPMVSPSLLGVSAGAGLGAAVGIVAGFGRIGVQWTAFGGALLAVALVYGGSRVVSSRNDMTLSLVLTGVVVGSLFSSLIALLKYVGDAYDDLPAITFWLMGGLSGITLKDTAITGIPVIAGIIGLCLVKWRMNIMTFSEEEALAMGVDTRRMRGFVILCATVITASVVSVCGTIGWIGLIVPHMARMLVGSDFRRSLPVSIVLGALLMLLIDDVSRGLFTTAVPLGILTSIIGTPFFFYLLMKGRRSW